MGNLGLGDTIKLFIFTSVTMLAFAANSLLNRFALLDNAIGPSGFASIRIISGGVVLLCLLMVRDRKIPNPPKPQFASIIGLTLYILGFSFAYVSMDAGIGALVLFGLVQVTMFVGAVLQKQSVPSQRWIGMMIAMAGLAIVSYPSGSINVTPTAIILMGLAAVGWGIYSLVGTRTTDPVSATTWNFVYATPFVLASLLMFPDSVSATWHGIALAVASGGITSALGYALWYSLLPKLGPTKSAVSQLSVPVIALILGVVLLDETVGATTLIAALAIVVGIAIGLMPSKKPYR